MAKWANDLMMDASLNYVAGSVRMVACSAQPANYAGIAAVTVLSRAATRAIVHQANSVAITAGVLPGITGASFATTGEAFDVVLVASDTVRGVYPATVTEG